MYDCFGDLHDDGVTYGAHIQDGVLSKTLQKLILHLPGEHTSQEHTSQDMQVKVIDVWLFEQSALHGV